MSQHPLRRYGVVLGITLLAGGLAGGLSGGLAAVVGSTNPLSIGITIVAVSVGMVVGILACVRWWRGLDEAAQEAHKWAWWWGSTGGLAVGGVVLLTFVTAATDQDVALPLSDRYLIYVSAMATFAFQAIGYGIAWAFWWLKRR